MFQRPLGPRPGGLGCEAVFKVYMTGKEVIPLRVSLTPAVAIDVQVLLPGILHF